MNNSPFLYSLFRIALGLYLAVHFLTLVPYAGEVFSNAGMLSDPKSSPLFNLLPSPFALNDSPWMAQTLLALGAVASIALAVGWWHRSAGIVAWLILAWLFARNPLIANPGMPYLGWILLFHACVPLTPTLAAHREESRLSDWRIPQPLVVAAWIILAASYSYSGFTKLFSPSWISGDTVALVLDNPLARDAWWRDLVSSLPAWLLRALTWTILVVELLFPLAIFGRLRPWFWSIMLMVQFGFLALLNFADLTIPMLMIHALTFDPAWLKRTSTDRPNRALLYDGACGLCHRVVRFAIAEGQHETTKIIPLQSKTADDLLGDQHPGLDSFVIVDNESRIFLRWNGAMAFLRGLRQPWPAIAWLLSVVPERVGNWLYDQVGQRRQRLFARPDEFCPMVPPSLRSRFDGGSA